MRYRDFLQADGFTFEICADDTAVLCIRRVQSAEESRANALTEQAKLELAAYLSAERKVLTFPVRAEGTAFQKQVWRAVSMLAYGQTCSYAAIAEAIGRPTAVRAVGRAIGANPLLIAVPCHRVVGKSGSLTGYAAGIGLKQKLLLLERENCEERLFTNDAQGTIIVP